MQHVITFSYFILLSVESLQVCQKVSFDPDNEEVSSEQHERNYNLSGEPQGLHVCTPIEMEKQPDADVCGALQQSGDFLQNIIMNPDEWEENRQRQLEHAKRLSQPRSSERSQTMKIQISLNSDSSDSDDSSDCDDTSSEYPTEVEILTKKKRGGGRKRKNVEEPTTLNNELSDSQDSSEQPIQVQPKKKMVGRRKIKNAEEPKSSNNEKRGGGRKRKNVEPTPPNNEPVDSQDSSEHHTEAETKKKWAGWRNGWHYYQEE